MPRSIRRYGYFDTVRHGSLGSQKGKQKNLLCYHQALKPRIAKNKQKKLMMPTFEEIIV